MVVDQSRYIDPGLDTYERQRQHEQHVHSDTFSLVDDPRFAATLLAEGPLRLYRRA